MSNTQLLDELIASFKGLSQDSRIWIFQAERALDTNEIEEAKKAINSFLPRWTSHNNALHAKGVVAFGHFIVIALDQSQSSAASGCSIDSMTHQIQAIGRHLNVNFQDRMTFYFLGEKTISGIHMNDAKEAYSDKIINDESLVFNNLVKTLGELKTSWIVPLSESWHKRFV